MVVAAGNERRARGRAKRRGVELRVAQPRLRDAVQVWCRNDAAESARHTVALVIGHDEQDVRCSFGWDDTRRPPRRGILGAVLNHAAKFRRRGWKLLSIDRGRGVSLTQRSRNLLRVRPSEKGRKGKRSHCQLPNACSKIHGRSPCVRAELASVRRRIAESWSCRPTHWRFRHWPLKFKVTYFPPKVKLIPATYLKLF